MSNQVISLTSSDEEDSSEPPPKKLKATQLMPEVTLTLVPAKTIDDASKSKTPIETVSLDSDDEISEEENGLLLKRALQKENISTKCTTPAKKPKNTADSTSNVDLISLTDDEDDQPKVNGEINLISNHNSKKKNCVQTNPETVSIIDDSDTEEVVTNIETETSREKSEKENTKKDKENNHSIIIDDSDDETEKENHCEKDLIEAFPVQIEKTSATDISSASAPQDDLAEAKALFKKFIRIVEEKIVDSSFEEILPRKAPIIKKYFSRSGMYANEKAFKSLLTESIESMKKSSTASAATSAVLSFHKVFENLKSHVAETTIIVDEDNLPKIKKLEHTIKLLRKRIRQLEVAEVNFDDDEDSAYIMLDRYQSRLNKVYAKYCQYINRNPYSGRATYDRITFVNSKYNQINQALTKKFKNSLVFPSYYELEKYVMKISKREQLNLSDAEITIESKKCFKALGNILQKKRRQELYDSHLDFVENSEDPATKDVSLENVLKKNFADGKEKIEKLYQKYVNKQERGEDHVSTDEEQSSEEKESDAENNKLKRGKNNKHSKIKSKTKDNGSKNGDKEKKEKKQATETKENCKEKQKNENDKKIENCGNETGVSDEVPKNEQRLPDTQREDPKSQEEKDKVDLFTALNIQVNEDLNKDNTDEDKKIENAL